MPRRQIFSVVLTVLAAFVAVPYATAAARFPAQAKAEAERNVLRVVARAWKPSRIPGLIDPRTHLLVNNTEAVCRGRGTRHAGGRYTRFVCVVRPRLHRPHQGLRVSYRVLSHGRFGIHWLAYKR
jgi:hypothetical protein